MLESNTCSGCQAVGELGECLEKLKTRVSEKYARHLDRRLDRLRRYVGHLMRCAVQQHFLETLTAKVANPRDPTYALIVLDFKVCFVRF